MQPAREFSALSPEEQDALPLDPATGLRIVASAKRGPITWLYLEDGSERVTDARGNTTTWDN